MTPARRVIVRPPRRARQWGITIVNSTLVAATHAGMKIIDLQNALETQLDRKFSNMTASALRFNVNYRLTGSTTGDDTTIAMGVCYISKAAFVASGVSVPDPSIDNYDWMFHDVRTLTSSRDVTDVDEQVFNSQLEIRNNSMRKQCENSSILVMVFRGVLLGATSVQIFVGGRTLFILP